MDIGCREQVYSANIARIVGFTLHCEEGRGHKLWLQ